MGDRPEVQRNNARVLDCLQEAVNAETTSRNLYWARSVFWRSVGMDGLAGYYLEQSQEDHAQRSADRMAFLGRQPDVAPERVSGIGEDVSQTLEPMSRGNSIVDQLKVDLEVENALADSYAGWIKVAEAADDYVTREIWSKVLRSTQDHVDLLQGWLKQIEMIGEDNWLAAHRV